MRLTLRLLVLAVLLSVASFTSLLSPVNYASPCTDGCANIYNSCLRDCPPGQNCSGSCGTKFDACMLKCGRPALGE